MEEDLTGYDVFTPAEAVKYLREERGMIFAVASLRNRRRYGQAQARHVLSNNTLWTKAELDAIKPSKRTKRAPLKKSALDGLDGDDPAASLSMMLMYNRQPQPLESCFDALIA